MIISWISACVPNKKIVYLQQENDLKESFPTDSIVRSYQLKMKQYELKPEDIISLRVASITPEEYNFVREYEQQLGQIRKLNQYQQNNVGSGNNNQMFNRGGLGNMGNDGGGGFSALMLDQMQSGFILDQQGELELPKIGVVNLAGLTISEAEKKITRLLTGFFETPMVRIQLLDFHFTILGEVNNEGRYTSFDPDINIFDALMLAGNLTEFADRSKIKIVRYQEEHANIIYVNTLDEGLLAANAFFLQPNDLIIVPPLEARSARKYTLPNASTLLSVVTAGASLILLVLSLR
ncbi:MAG: polysaccharide biosynthesis/export family protein [Candidatus Cyclobacteriaceae bacterium M3_2C_046]